MNHVLSTLWPSYNQAIGKMVLETAEPYISDITKQVEYTLLFTFKVNAEKPLHQITGIFNCCRLEIHHSLAQ